MKGLINSKMKDICASGIPGPRSFVHESVIHSSSCCLITLCVWTQRRRVLGVTGTPFFLSIHENGKYNILYPIFHPVLLHPVDLGVPGLDPPPPLVRPV